jgi:hypothetical protein
MKSVRSPYRQVELVLHATAMKTSLIETAVKALQNTVVSQL